MDTNWHVQDNTEQQFGQLRVDSNEGCVCVVGENTREWQVDDERRRMAHLIAAAPVLLESLKDAYDALDYAQAQVDSDDERWRLTGCRRRIKPVIDKAEGRS